MRSPNASCDVRSGRTDREVTLWGLNREMATTLALIFLTASTGSLTAAQREVVRQVDQRLLAPCCYSQPVGEHLSAEAAQMRMEIEAMAASGQSEAAIIAHYKHSTANESWWCPMAEREEFSLSFRRPRSSSSRQSSFWRFGGWSGRGARLPLGPIKKSWNAYGENLVKSLIGN